MIYEEEEARQQLESVKAMLDSDANFTKLKG